MAQDIRWAISHYGYRGAALVQLGYSRIEIIRSMSIFVDEWREQE